MMNYTITYRRRFLYTKIRGCIGHKYDATQNKLCIFLDSERGLIEIKNWDKHEVKLGNDWVKYVDAQHKAEIEQEAKGKPNGIH